MKTNLEIKIYRNDNGPLCWKSRKEVCVFLEQRKFGSSLACFWDAEKLDLSDPEDYVRPFSGCPLKHG